MSDETTPRLALPLLQTGQAQKELSHNEALTLLDFGVQAVVTMVGLNSPPTGPAVGACWVVGTAPTGAWTGQADALAGWTANGWRFVAVREGMAAWSLADDALARYSAGAWQIGQIRGTTLTLASQQVVGARQPAVASPSGGTVIDTEARAALTAILGALRTHGLISG